MHMNAYGKKQHHFREKTTLHPTPRAMRTIEMDKHRRGSVAKRVPTNAKRDVTTRTFVPGKVFVLDAATYPARDVVKQIPDRTGAAPPTCMLHAWDDSPSDMGYTA